MNEKYKEYIRAFKNLDIDEKKKEIMNNTLDLLQLLYDINSKLNDNNDVLPVLREYTNDDEFFNKLFTCIISLKEENAKLIEYVITENK